MSIGIAANNVFAFANQEIIAYSSHRQPTGKSLVAMIVCSCNVFSDQDVRSAVNTADEKPVTCGQVYGCLGCSAQCGRCARTIRKIMDEALSACPVPADVACAHVHVRAETE